MPKNLFEYLQHIHDECQYILSVSNITYYEFIDDETLKRAVVRSLEIIGEATKKLPQDFRSAHDNVNWKTWPVCVISSSMIILGLIMQLFGM